MQAGRTQCATALEADHHAPALGGAGIEDGGYLTGTSTHIFPGIFCRKAGL